MSYFVGPHIMVETPITTDGRTPKLIRGKQQYRVDYLPLRMKPILERKNQRLPEILRKIITVVDDGTPAPSKRGRKPNAQ